MAQTSVLKLNIYDPTGENAGTTMEQYIQGVSGTTDSNMVKIDNLFQEDSVNVNNVTIKNVTIKNEKIANGAITDGKLANGAVTTAKIANSAVTDDKFAIPKANLTDFNTHKNDTAVHVTDGHRYMWNGKASKVNTAMETVILDKTKWTESIHGCTYSIPSKLGVGEPSQIHVLPPFSYIDITVDSTNREITFFSKNHDVTLQDITVEIIPSHNESIDFPEHYNDTVTHVTQADKTNWNSGTNIADGAINTAKIANGAVTDDKLATPKANMSKNSYSTSILPVEWLANGRGNYDCTKTVEYATQISQIEVLNNFNIEVVLNNIGTSEFTFTTTNGTQPSENVNFLVKYGQVDFPQHDEDIIRHVTQTDRNNWNSGTNIADGAVTTAKIANSAVTDDKFATPKANQTDFNTHRNDTAVHVNQGDRRYWDNKDDKVDSNVTYRSAVTLKKEDWIEVQIGLFTQSVTFDIFKVANVTIPANSNEIALRDSIILPARELQFSARRTLEGYPPQNDITISFNFNYDDVDLLAHHSDGVRHVTQVDKNNWNSKANLTDFNAHKNDTFDHVTQADKTKWNSGTNIADGAVGLTKLNQLVRDAIANKDTETGNWVTTVKCTKKDGTIIPVTNFSGKFARAGKVCTVHGSCTLNGLGVTFDQFSLLEINSLPFSSPVLYQQGTAVIALTDGSGRKDIPCFAYTSSQGAVIIEVIDKTVTSALPFGSIAVSLNYIVN